MLYNDDCLKVMDELITQNIKVDLIVTDPPYRLTSKGNTGNSGGMYKNKAVRTGKVFEHNDINVSEFAPKLYDLLKDGSHCYVMCNHRNLIEYLNVFTGCGFKFIKSLIWDKINKIMGTFYMNQFEYILFFRKGAGIKINDCSTSDIISIQNKKDKNQDGSNIHDSQKPVELMEILIKNSSAIGDIVLDPFMGSGSTGVACSNLDREFIGIELDKGYFDIATNRINCNKKRGLY